MRLEPRSQENSSTGVPSVYAAIQSYTVDRNWNSAYPGDSAATRGLATTADASSAASTTGYLGFLDSGPADRARVAEAYCRAAMPGPDHLSGLPVSKISRRLCLADWRAAKPFSFKVGCSITKDLWLVFTSAEHNVGKSSCHSNNPAKASHSHFLPSEIFEEFLLCSTTNFYWQISFIRASCTGVQTPTSL